MRYAPFLLLALSSATLPSHAVEYLSSIQQRWDASDFVCIGHASAPVPTGQSKSIDGSERDELSAEVAIERCLKGKMPTTEIRVFGYDVVARKEIGQGYAYAGPPVGFLNEGRNLLFLRGTPNPDQYEVTVPIYETAIHLADKNPYQRSDEGRSSTRLIITRELEGALVQFGDTNLSYMDYLIDFLGTQDGIVELSRLSSSVPTATQRDIAVAVLLRGRPDMQSEVISLLLDTSAPSWKRENAASALGEHGTDAAVRPLQDIASQPDTSLRRWALEALSKIAARDQAAEGPTTVP
jgi:hypothetical protein